MRYTKGEWKASYKDTWSVETTLNKIVLAHIEKLYQCLKKSEYHGVPMRYVEKQALIQGVDPWGNGADITAADELRSKDLEELIWTFSDNEPDMDDYSFHIEIVSGESNDNGTSPVTFVTTGLNGKDGDAEKERYHHDMLAYNKRKEAGYKLFGEIYSTLDN